MNSEKFEELVSEALDNLPAEFMDRLENIEVIVQDYPSRKQLSRVGRGMTLLGLYEGVPHTRRNQGYGLVLPDKITIFQKPIEARCRNEAETISEVQRVVYHEIAHRFGLDDKTLYKIEAEKSRRKKG